MPVSIRSYGAKPNDALAAAANATAIQAALNDAALPNRDGVVSIPWGRFWVGTGLTVNENVSLVGEGCGPHDPMYPPWDKTVGPSLLVTDRNAPAVWFTGNNWGLRDVIIAHPEQKRVNDPGVETHGPLQYPVTVRADGTGRMSNCLLANSYKGVLVRCGRVRIDNCNITGFLNDIEIDNAYDTVHISHTILGRFGAWFTSPVIGMDFWVLNHGTGIISRKADDLQLSDVLIYGRETAVLLAENTQVTEGATSGFASNLNLDTVRNGIVAEATHPAFGFVVNNLGLGPFWDVPLGYALWTKTPASAMTPRLMANGVSVRGLWAAPKFRRDLGSELRYVNVMPA